MATQAHPELKSRPNRPHPLFRDFVGAAAERAGLAGRPVEERAASVTVARSSRVTTPQHEKA